MHRRARFLAFSIIGAALIVGGIAGVLASTSSAGRFLGVGALAFGVSMGAAATMLAPTRRPRSARSTRAEVDGVSVAAVELGVPRRRSAAAALGAGAFAVASAALAATGAVVIGLLGAFVFGVMAVLGVMNVMRRSTFLLTESGIVSRTGSGEIAIRWDDVAAVYERRANGTRMAIVAADEPPAVSSFGLRLVNRATRGWFGDLSIPLDIVDAPPNAVLAEIVRLTDEPDARAGVASGEVARRLAPAGENLTPASPR